MLFWMANDVKLLDKDLSAKLKQIFYFVSDTKKKLDKIDEASLSIFGKTLVKNLKIYYLYPDCWKV